MAEFLQMIALSPTMEEGRIAKWNKEEGQSFASGDVLCEVETDKASMDYEAPKSAALLKIIVPAGQTVKVGAPIAIIGALGESVEALLAAHGGAQNTTQGTEAQPIEQSGAQLANQAKLEDALQSATLQPTTLQPNAAILSQSPLEAAFQGPTERLTPSGLPPSSPLARKRAQEAGIDLRTCSWLWPWRQGCRKRCACICCKSNAGGERDGIAGHKCSHTATRE